MHAHGFHQTIFQGRLCQIYRSVSGGIYSFVLQILSLLLISYLNMSSGSDKELHASSIHLVPSPLITKRNRTPSTCERILKTDALYGEIKSFCREKGHGFISPEDGSNDIFVHISDIEDEYIPLPGDRVKYQLCPIPPKFEKYQAVHVHIVNLKPDIHKRWEF